MISETRELPVVVTGFLLFYSTCQSGVNQVAIVRGEMEGPVSRQTAYEGPEPQPDD
jgi:hypothetical protein